MNYQVWAQLPGKDRRWRGQAIHCDLASACENAEGLQQTYPDHAFCVAPSGSFPITDADFCRLKGWRDD